MRATCRNGLEQELSVLAGMSPREVIPSNGTGEPGGNPRPCAEGRCVELKAGPWARPGERGLACQLRP